MAANKDVQDFFELRAGLVGLRDFGANMLAFANGALALLDRHGIGMARANGRAHSNGNGNGTNALIATVKRQYLRHQAAFPTTPAAAPRQTAAEKKLAVRQASAALLSQLDTAEPRELKHRSIGSLLRRGYVRRKGNGYVRTSKVYHVGAPAPEAPADSPADASDAMTVKEAARALKMSDANVRLLIKGNKLTARQELRPRKGSSKPLPLVVIPREEIQRYQATS